MNKTPAGSTIEATKEMPPKSKRSNATMACSTNSSSSSYFNPKALEPRRQFIVTLVEYAPLYRPLSCDTPRRSTDSSMFNPFEYAFLASAPEQTISLLAKVCIKARWTPTLLAIPPELRLRIYDFAFEGHWEEPAKHARWCIRVYTILAGSWEPDKTKRDALGFHALKPPILRTCKLFRKEGIE